MQGQRVVDTVAEEADRSPGRRGEVISCAFCSGEMRAKIVLFCAAAVNSSAPRGSSWAPVMVPLDAKPKSAQTFSATRGLSPVAIFSSMPRSAS